MKLANSLILLMTALPWICLGGTKTPAPTAQNQAKDTPLFRAVVPIPAAFYTPETGVGGGVGIVHAYRADDAPDELRDSNLVPVLLYTEKKQTIARVVWEHYGQQGRVHSLWKAGFTDYPDRFYGIGNDTLADDFEHFTETYHNFDADLNRLVAPNMFLGLALRYDRFTIRHKVAGGRLHSENIPGADQGSLRGAGMNLLYNSRDNVFSPNVGSKHEFSWIAYPEELGGDFAYQHRSLRLRQYLPIKPGYALIAWEVFLIDQIGEVPFRKLGMLGGQFNLRGYFLGRFRDKKSLSSQIAWRQYFAKRWSYTVFIASGAVAPTWTSWSTQTQRLSYGAGIRYVINLDTGINFRMDYGRGQDGRGFYVGVGEAF